MVKNVISKDLKQKRVDTNLKFKKAPTKLELELQAKNVQQANHALEERHKRILNLLKVLVEKSRT
jgi:hypothetical protein